MSTHTGTQAVPTPEGRSPWPGSSHRAVCIATLPTVTTRPSLHRRPDGCSPPPLGLPAVSWRVSSTESGLFMFAPFFPAHRRRMSNACGVVAPQTRIGKIKNVDSVRHDAPPLLLFKFLINNLQLGVMNTTEPLGVPGTGRTGDTDGSR